MKRCARLLLLVLACTAAGAGGADAEAQATSSGPRYSLSVGAGGPYAWNFVAATAEYFPGSGDRFSLFLTGGFGTILIGGGAAVYAEGPGSGAFASATAGLAGAHAQLGYQLPLNDRLSAAAGVGAGSYFLQHNGVLPFASLVYSW